MVFSQLSSSYQRRAFSTGTAALDYGSLRESASTHAHAQPSLQLPGLFPRFLLYPGPFPVAFLVCLQIGGRELRRVVTLCTQWRGKESLQTQARQRKTNTDTPSLQASLLVFTGQCLPLLNLIILFASIWAGKGWKSDKICLRIIKLMLRSFKLLSKDLYFISGTHN